MKASASPSCRGFRAGRPVPKRLLMGPKGIRRRLSLPPIPAPFYCQVGSCLTPATNLPKALPLDSGECSALRFSHFAKGKKIMKKNSGRKTRFQQRRTLRLTVEEDDRLSRQAATAGISVSEYMRRLFFGGRPIVAKTDGQTIRELRRLGGLLKHHFETVRAAGRPEGLEAITERF